MSIKENIKEKASFLDNYNNISSRSNTNQISLFAMMIYFNGSDDEKAELDNEVKTGGNLNSAKKPISKGKRVAEFLLEHKDVKIRTSNHAIDFEELSNYSASNPPNLIVSSLYNEILEMEKRKRIYGCYNFS